MSWIIAAVITWQGGAECQVTNANWNGWGNLTVESVVVHAPNWPGTTNELIHVQGIHVQFKPANLLLGKVGFVWLH